MRTPKIGWLECGPWRKLGQSDEGSLKAALYVPVRRACPNEPTRQIDHLLAKHRRAPAGDVDTETTGHTGRPVLCCKQLYLHWVLGRRGPSLALPLPLAPFPPKGPTLGNAATAPRVSLGWFHNRHSFVRRGTKRDKRRVAIRSYTPPPPLPRRATCLSPVAPCGGCLEDACGRISQ